ncbi:MAG TPA: Na-translocating system protein MpsC family protein [Solirubrobacterales bacterium]
MTDGQPRLGAELAEVTKGMVSLHRRFYGKGPTEAKTYAIDDTVICILEGGFTTDPDLAVELFMLEPHEADESE